MWRCASRSAGALDQRIAEKVPSPPLSLGGTCVAIGIGLAAVALLAASAVDRPLGLPTFIAGLVVTIVVLCISRQSPLPVLRDISWGVLPLVAGLFILVEGVERTGILDVLVRVLQEATAASPRSAAAGAGVVAAFASNLLNNLPTGLIAATVSQSADVPVQVRAGLLIGVDLGPNLSVTGSLATILWLTALRREGELVTAWQFLKLGIVVMPPALLRRWRHWFGCRRSNPTPSLAKASSPPAAFRAVGADGDLDLVLALQRNAVAPCQDRVGDFGLAVQHEGIEAVRPGGAIDVAPVAVAQQARDLEVWPIGRRPARRPPGR